MDPYPHGVERDKGGCEASGVEEKPGRGRHGVGGGVKFSLDESTHHREGRGVESSQDELTSNGGGGGDKSWHDDSTPKPNGGGVESSWDDSTPREDGEPKEVETLGSPTESRSRRGEDGRGQGGGHKNPPTARSTRDRLPNGGYGAAQ